MALNRYILMYNLRKESKNEKKIRKVAIRNNQTLIKAYRRVHSNLLYIELASSLVS